MLAEQTLRPGERTAILHAAKDIRTYKLMQAIGFGRLVSKTQEQRTRQLLAELSDQEQQDVAHWSQAIAELQGSQPGPDRFLKQRVVLMMGILGVRGFFEWALIAEDEAVEELSIHAGNIADQPTAEGWTRIATDERLHVANMKQDVVGMEAWEMGGGGGVRDVIFGANDGLVSILALVAGVFGAVTDSQMVLIAGVAGAVAGTISMGAGAYVSSKSEQEVTQKEQKRKGWGRKQSPEEEQEELVGFYEDRGFARTTAETIAERVAKQMAQTESLSIGEETGLTNAEEWTPPKAGLLTGLSFLIASLIPILPFVFFGPVPAAILATVASIAAMFLVGASKAIFTRQNWWRSGLEVMIVGTLASIATFIIGQFIPI